jgi:hypothetical protein
VVVLEELHYNPSQKLPEQIGGLSIHLLKNKTGQET